MTTFDRIKGRHSIHDAEILDAPPHVCHWRVVFCDFEQDIVECSVCGKQVKTACDFEEEYQ